MTREEAEKEIRYAFTETYANEIIKALDQAPVIESAYKTGYETGRLIGMIDSVRKRY